MYIIFNVKRQVSDNYSVTDIIFMQNKLKVYLNDFYKTHFKPKYIKIYFEVYSFVVYIVYFNDISPLI